VGAPPLAECVRWIKIAAAGAYFLRAPTILAWDLGALCRILRIVERSP
jgi:hypothetical protein